MAIEPGRLAVDRDEDRGRAVLAQPLGLASSGAVAMLSSARKRALPSATRLRSTVPITPLPVGDSKPPHRRERRVRARRRPATIAARERMLAGALEAGGKPQHLASSKPRPRTMATTLGLPSVSVPVLSTTSVSTFSMRFERLGILDQHAAPRRRGRRPP